MRDLSAEHLAALAATAALSALLVAGARRGGRAFSRPARLVLGERRRPRAGSALRAYAVRAGFAVLAAIATLASGATTSSCAASRRAARCWWPVYIAAAAALGLALFLLLEAVARHYPAADAQGTARTGRRAAGHDARG